MNIKKNFLFLMLGLLMTFLLPNYANAALIFTFEAAGVQNTTVPAGEYKVETFNNLSIGDKSGSAAVFVSAIGSFSGSYNIGDANVWGGAGGNTRFITSSNATLSFTNPIGYFGFWWSAGSNNNYLSITTVDNVVHQFTTTTLMNSGLLSQNHFGNPNPAFLGQNNGEPYVFLNFFATDTGSKIKSINLSGTGFESDNYTTAVNIQTTTGTMVQGSCTAPQSAGTYPNCSCPSPKVLNADGTVCITPVAPTVISTSTTDSVAVDIHGTFGTSTTISSVVLTKSGSSAITLGAISAETGGWKVSSGTTVKAGTYTITVTDTNGKSATGTLTVTAKCSSIVTSTEGSFGLDTKGALLCFDSPEKVSGTGIVTDAKQGDVYKYTNVITVNGTQVDAVVTITALVNMTTLVFDDPTPNPSSGDGRASGGNYTTSFGAVVPEAAIFAPQEWSTDKTTEAYATFVISFQDTTGKPVVLQNVYNNSLDIESTEYNAYGGFSSYLVSPDNKTNTAKHVIATPSGTNIRFSSSDCTGDQGLYIKDQSRVQTKFATISTLTLKLGQFANGQVPNDSGSHSSCTNSSQRYYGAIFVQDNFIDTPGTQIEVTAPTVNLLTTSNTKPTITGTIGGNVSGVSDASSTGSALSGTDTFSVLVNGVTYSTTPTALTSTQTSGKLTVSGTTWSLQFLTPLAVQSYEVTATRNGFLVDQTSNELVITLSCTSPQVLNATGTACVTPVISGTEKLWCHSGDGIYYSKSMLASTDYSHITHVFDQEADSAGKCPNDVVTCDFGTSGTVLNSGGTACVTPTAPTATNESTTEGTATNLSGGVGTSTTISSVILTKLTDGLGAAVSNATPTTILNVSVASSIWSVSSGTSIAVGTYRITVTDGYSKTATATLTVTCPTTGKTIATATACIAPVAPTVTSTNTTEGTAVTINGGATTSNKISSVTLTKITDGLGASVTNTASSIGTNLTVSNNQWSVSSGTAITVGTYTITAIDGNNLSGTGTLIVTCPTGKLSNSTGTACIAPVAPTVTSTSTTEGIAATIGGTATTSNKISSVTLTKIMDGLGASITSTASSIGTNLTVTNNQWSVNSGTTITVGTYTITATDGNNLSGTGTLTVTCPTGKIATASACVIPSAPTVSNATTTDSVPVVIHGAFGTSTTITSVTLTKKGSGVVTTLGAITVDAPRTSWTVSSGIVSVGTYTIIARDANNLESAPATLTVTCAGSKVTNSAGNACISAPTITASQPFSTTTPTITGTVGSSDATGNPILGTFEAFSVTVNNVTYVYGGTDNTLRVTGAAWTLTIPTIKALTAGQTYTVIATRDNTLNATGSITINGAPSVNTKSTFDTTPVLTGSIGSASLGADTFTVSVNSQTYSYTAGVTTEGNVIINADLTWSLTIPKGKEIAAKTAAYDVVATRGTLTDSTTGELTIKFCALPSIVNETTDTCSIPVPTVVPAAWNSNTTAARIITGTVGDVALGDNESFSVTITSAATSLQIGNYSRNQLVFDNAKINWTLTIPTATAIVAGTYSVEAARNTTAKNADAAGKLVVSLVCNSGETVVNGVCISQTILPTVNSDTTSDTKPVITGTVGTLVLNNTDVFNVTVEGSNRTFTSGDGYLVVTNKAWTLTMPDVLNTGSHTVVASRNDVTGTGIITITECTKFLNSAGHCVDASLVPTVDSAASHDINDAKIVVTGTVGDVELSEKEQTDNAFTVTVTEHGNSSHTLTGALLVNGTTWTFELSSRSAGTFDVNAVRSGKPDLSDSELVITDKISICDNNVDKSIERTEWVAANDSPTYYLGKCQSTTCTNPPNNTIPAGCAAVLPDPKDLPPKPDAAVNATVKVNGLIYCSDGGVMSDSDMTVTIKRTKIENASTDSGTIAAADLVGARVKYGVKTQGGLDITGATRVTREQWTGVTLTNVTIEEAFIDAAVDYVNPDGTFNTSVDSYIKVTGGITKPTTTKEDNTITRASIISGVIVSGTAADGNPVRGTITSGVYNSDVTNADTVITKGRRIKGAIKNATITGARITTMNGKTVVDEGIITSAQMDTITTPSAFGSVENAKLDNVSVTNSNHCFSSGAVGSKGQLNWKEVVKE